MLSVLRDWVMELPLRHQGVLVAAVRGCDGAPKENSAKPIIRALRYAVMNPADEREVGMDSAFMKRGFTEDELMGFLRDWDHYPVHFVQHLMHACQVVAFCGSHDNGALAFQSAYYGMVSKLHLNPESPSQMHDRLTEDRIAKYGNATGETPANPIPASSVYSNERFLTPNPEPDEYVHIIIIGSNQNRSIPWRWETGPSYLGSRVAKSGFDNAFKAAMDARDRFDPTEIRVTFRDDML